MWSVRAVVESVVEHGRRALHHQLRRRHPQQQQPHPRPQGRQQLSGPKLSKVRECGSTRVTVRSTKSVPINSFKPMLFNYNLMQELTSMFTLHPYVVQVSDARANQYPHFYPYAVIPRSARIKDVLHVYFREFSSHNRNLWILNNVSLIKQTTRPGYNLIHWEVTA